MKFSLSIISDTGVQKEGNRVCFYILTRINGEQKIINDNQKLF